MKKLFLLLFILVSQLCFTQSETDVKPSDYMIIERVPIYPGCNENQSNYELKKCMMQNITNHVGQNFNINIANSLDLDGTQRISVIFKIDKNGDVIDIKARGPHSELEKEAVRVIKLLPKLKPGTQKGKPVTVPYALPIKFEVQKSKTTQLKKTRKEYLETNTLDSFPLHKRCSEKLSFEQQKECTINKIIDFIRVSFDTEMASKLFPQEQSTKFLVSFTINQKGKIENINAKAHKREIAVEAIRVLRQLPKLKRPGLKNNKPVSTPFSFIMTVYFQDF